MRPPSWVLVCVASELFAAGASREARAADGGATFALVIGSNVSVDRDVAPLRYADDDAADYFELFRLLGARTYLLTRLDDNTRGLHPQAAAEAAAPTRAALDRAAEQIAAEVSQARNRQVQTDLYVVYAGHGNVDGDQGYVALEDARVTGTDLERLIAPIPATRVHVIVDACASYFLAYSRGPGGERRPFHEFQDSGPLADDPRVGLLLSTSSARDSHEWDGFQAGVFSHEVRSGLYGAADADGDGLVSYREIAAFVTRANAAIPNERFRPNVHARAPRQSEALLDIRRALGRRLEIDGAHAGRYSIEDARGVRLADLHNDEGQPVRIVRPARNGPLFVRRADDDVEFTVSSAADVVSLAEEGGHLPRVATRGAAHEAFSLLFALPFSRGVVDAFVEPGGEPEPTLAGDPAGELAPVARVSVQRAFGWGLVGLGAVGVGIGAALSAMAAEEASGAPARPSQAEAADRNARITAFGTGAAIAYIGGGLAAVSGAAVLLWPESKRLHAALVPGGAFVSYETPFF